MAQQPNSTLPLTLEQRTSAIKNLVKNMKQISDVNVLKRTELFKKYAQMAYSATLIGLDKEEDVKNSLRIVESSIQDEGTDTNRPPVIINTNGKFESHY
jgi:hypothetical protein